MVNRNKQAPIKLQTNNKFRTSSAIVCLNKDYIRSARKLRKIAEGIEEASESQIKALEAIVSLLLPYDPLLAPPANVVSTEAINGSQ
jgi:hypothetical protein